MLAKAIGKQLTCVFVDHGLLRKNEKEEVCSVFGPGNANGFDINFICVDARDRYFSKLAGVTEPERKRKIIGEEFIRVFEEQAKQIGKVDFLAQGTIYPDVVESAWAANPLSSRATTMSAACLIPWTLRSWWSPCATCSRMRCVRLAANWACLSIWSAVSRSPAPVWASASSVR